MVDRTEFVEAWLHTCRQEFGNPHLSLGLLKMSIYDAEYLIYEIFWFRPAMVDSEWIRLREFIGAAFDTWSAQRTKLVLCREDHAGRVTFNGASSSRSVKELITRAHRDALNELRSVS